MLKDNILMRLFIVGFAGLNPWIVKKGHILHPGNNTSFASCKTALTYCKCTLPSSRSTRTLCKSTWLERRSTRTLCKST